MWLVEQNNVAVSLLQNGCTEPATKTLELALKGILVSHAPGVSTTPMSTPAQAPQSVPVCLHAADTCAQPLRRSDSGLMVDADTPNDESAPQCQHHSSCTFIYHRAFYVSAHEHSPHLVGAIILYHLALLNHLQGIQTCDSKKLLSAKKLYLFALDFVKKHSQACGSRRALLVSLAIANNLGDLFWQELRNVAEAQKCFSLVRETLRYMGHLQANESEGCSEKDYAFFVLNALIRLGTDVHVATAA